MNLRGLIKYTLFRDTTQHGEFRLMRKLAGTAGARVVVDVGANDGFYGSNSFPFVARGWRALLIEPHPGAFAKLKRLHGDKPNVTLLNLACADVPGKLPLWIGKDGDEGTLATLCTDDHPQFKEARTNESVLVPVERLDAVLAAHKIPADFAVLSTIDTEGMDYEVLLGLDLKLWRPRVIVTEDYVPKDAKKADYLGSAGYVHAGQLTANAFWVPKRR
jgi:FkbM family methyltransferase